jgi:hypothetical protein
MGSRPEDYSVIPRRVCEEMRRRWPEWKAEWEAEDAIVLALHDAMNRRALGRRVVTMASDAAEQARRSDNPVRIRRESLMRSFQLFEYAIGVKPGTMHTPDRYAKAAEMLFIDGDADGSAILNNFSRLLRVPEPFRHRPETPADRLASRILFGEPMPVGAHHRAWCSRHHTWRMFPAEGPWTWNWSSAVRSSGGRPWRGTDGSQYALFHAEGMPGGPFPAIGIRTSAGQDEAMVFRQESDARRWLAGRAPGASGPLCTTADGGPATGTVYEEEILARLLKDPDEPALHGLIPDICLFTSHLRAELYWAVTRWEPGQVREKFADAMLRAPGWALRETGWDGRRALAYLDRLQVTPATPAQAHRAGVELRSAWEHAQKDGDIVLTADSDLSQLAKRPDLVRDAGLEVKKREEFDFGRISIRGANADIDRALSHPFIPEYIELGETPGPRDRWLLSRPPRAMSYRERENYRRVQEERGVKPPSRRLPLPTLDDQRKQRKLPGRKRAVQPPPPLPDSQDQIQRH